MNSSVVLSAVLLVVSVFASHVKKDQLAVRAASAASAASTSQAADQPDSFWAAWAEAAAH